MTYDDGEAGGRQCEADSPEYGRTGVVPREGGVTEPEHILALLLALLLLLLLQLLVLLELSAGVEADCRTQGLGAAQEGQQPGPTDKTLDEDGDGDGEDGEADRQLVEEGQGRE